MENSHGNFVESTVEKFNMADIENLEMVRVTDLRLLIVSFLSNSEIEMSSSSTPKLLWVFFLPLIDLHASPTAGEL